MLATILSLIATLGVLDPNVLPADEDGAKPASVSKAARDYRIQVYNTFHKQRDEYNRRFKAGAQVWKFWRDAGQNEANRDQFIDWYVSATEASLPETIVGLPTTDQLPQSLVSTDAPPLPFDNHPNADNKQNANQDQFNDSNDGEFYHDSLPSDDAFNDGNINPGSTENQEDGSAISPFTDTSSASPVSKITAPLAKSAALSALGRSLFRSISSN